MAGEADKSLSSVIKVHLVCSVEVERCQEALLFSRWALVAKRFLLDTPGCCFVFGVSGTFFTKLLFGSMSSVCFSLAAPKKGFVDEVHHLHTEAPTGA